MPEFAWSATIGGKMWYLLKVDALIGALVFGAAGLVISAMFAWEAARKVADAALGARKRESYTKLGTSFPRAA